MKKLFKIIFSLVLLLALTACKFDQVDDSELINQGYTCVVTYDANGGKIGNYSERRIYVKPDSYVCEMGTNGLPQAIKQGLILEGWYLGTKDEDGNVTLSTKFDFSSTKVTESITLYANWVNYYTYTINYGYDQETNTYTRNTVLSTVNSTDLITKPTINPSWPGHTFLGYYEDPEFTQEFDWSYIHSYDENRNHNLYAKFLDGNYVLAKTANDLKSIKSGTNIYLLNDIDMTDTVMSIANEYKGTILGNGYKISNIAVSYEQGGITDVNFGLFKKLTNATIKDVTFENVTVNAKVGLDKQYRVGAFSGSENSTTIENVSINNATLNITLGSGLNESAFKSESDKVFGEIKSSTNTNLTFTSIAINFN